MINKSLRKAVALSILLCTTSTYPVKFEAADVINSLQAIAAGVLLPLIITHDAAIAPDLSAVNKHATPAFQKMCTNWKKARKPYVVRDACQELNELLDAVDQHRRAPDKHIMHPVVAKIARAYHKKNSPKIAPIIADMKAKLNALKEEIAASPGMQPAAQGHQKIQ
jgi:hypothetical protein